MYLLIDISEHQIIADYFNGPDGKALTGIDDVHGAKGVSPRNVEGKTQLHFCCAGDVVMIFNLFTEEK